MLRIHPFVMGHLIGAVLTGGAAGAFSDPRAAFIGALALFGGALVSSYVCQWWPGVEAPAWKLWLVAVFANPVMLAALGFNVTQLVYGDDGHTAELHMREHFDFAASWLVQRLRVAN